MVQSTVASSQARVLHAGDGLAVAEVGTVCIALWRDAVTRPTFEKQRACLDDLVRRFPGDTGFICIVEPDSRPPDDELRRASSQMVNAHGADLKCVACVIEGSGFKASIARSVLSGMAYLLRSPVRLQMFDSVASGAEWMQRFVSMIPPPAFVRVVEDLRRRLPARSE